MKWIFIILAVTILAIFIIAKIYKREWTKILGYEPTNDEMDIITKLEPNYSKDKIKNMINDYKNGTLDKSTIEAFIKDEKEASKKLKEELKVIETRDETISDNNDISEQLRKSFIKAYIEGLCFEDWLKKEKTMLKKLNFLIEIEVLQKNGKKKIKLIYEDKLYDVFKVNNKLCNFINRYESCTNSFFEYFIYHAGNCTIKSHQVLNNLALPKNHIFWNTHFPPNALKCDCSIRCYGKRDLEVKSLKVTTEIPLIKLQSLYNTNYAKKKEITNKLITPYLNKIDISQKVRKIYTNGYINLALEDVKYANSLKTIKSKNKYLDIALITLSEGLKDVHTDNELLNIEIDKINKYKQDLNTL